MIAYASVYYIKFSHYITLYHEDQISIPDKPDHTIYKGEHGKNNDFNLITCNQFGIVHNCCSPVLLELYHLRW